MKTLEEAVDKASLLEFPIKEWYRSDDYSREEITAARDGFKRGYKLALERSYSEEEVLEILVKAIKDVKVKQLTFYDGGSEYPIYSNLSKWFEKFKKK